ncbi:MULTISPECIES: PP2C family protein-serine/threonine phosphatase [unclassified Streptomyces]|uniref:PP2C family protein-serine/threonine phosphatase n=1 Tax=unclassified Streptomyces TaxID=2593676 RepID=UPI00166108E9|nr:MULTISPECIES: PP2C family protein-serine/threonine phosphatase [unclassified Streptomyces]MBD0712278.1 phosphatase [Streptomyces sp. CBMA291]MBD0714110.1 phosphatase [Streptomyces sp. CBMA370]
MIRTRALVSGGSRLRRMAPLVLPTAWGAVAVAWKYGCPLARQQGLPMRITTSVVFLTVGIGLIVGVRHGLVRELARVRAIATATQQVLLRPPPARLDGLALAAGQLSASRGAVVGGDLYEAAATPYGVRVVIGDVRGHGLAALGAVVAVLGSFREAAHDEPELAGVLRRLERALDRHLRERARDEHPARSGTAPEHPVAEEFVTLLLLEIRPDGRLAVFNCGHPGPYRLGSAVERLTVGEPLPPLGVLPLPAVLTPYTAARLLPGETLVLHTDGAEEARDRRGRFFALDTALAGEPGEPPAALVRRVHTALLHHTGGRLTDDVALLVVRNDRIRVPAQPAESGLRRPRPAPSSHR